MGGNSRRGDDDNMALSHSMLLNNCFLVIVKLVNKQEQMIWVKCCRASSMTVSIQQILGLSNHSEAVNQSQADARYRISMNQYGDLGQCLLVVILAAKGTRNWVRSISVHCLGIMNTLRASIVAFQL